MKEKNYNDNLAMVVATCFSVVIGIGIFSELVGVVYVAVYGW